LAPDRRKSAFSQVPEADPQRWKKAWSIIFCRIFQEILRKN